MAKPISKTIINMMIELYNKGMPITHIADELRVDKVTVHKYLNETGTKEVDPELSKKAGNRLTDTEKVQIINMYKAGMEIEHIMETVGCSAPTLYTYLRREGLTRKIGDKVSAEAVRLVVNQKMPVKQVAERTGLSVPTVYRRVRDYKNGKLDINV